MAKKYSPLLRVRARGSNGHILYLAYHFVFREDSEAQAEPCTTLKADEVEGQDVVHAKMEL